MEKETLNNITVQTQSTRAIEPGGSTQASKPSAKPN